MPTLVGVSRACAFRVGLRFRLRFLLDAHAQFNAVRAQALKQPLRTPFSRVRLAGQLCLRTARLDLDSRIVEPQQIERDTLVHTVALVTEPPDVLCRLRWAHPPDQLDSVSQVTHVPAARTASAMLVSKRLDLLPQLGGVTAQLDERTVRFQLGEVEMPAEADTERVDVKARSRDLERACGHVFQPNRARSGAYLANLHLEPPKRCRARHSSSNRRTKPHSASRSEHADQAKQCGDLRSPRQVHEYVHSRLSLVATGARSRKSPRRAPRRRS